ncbi:hypothetical protein Tco_1411510 [Tanacetum coccineum]
MLAICAADKPVVFKAPKPSSIDERVPQRTKPRAQPGYKKAIFLKQPFVSSKEATKASSSTIVDPGMHKEDQQATGGPTSLGVTSEERANPQLSSGMSAFNLNEPIYSASFIIHSESSSGNYALAVSIVEADLRNFAPSDFVPQQQEQTKSISEGLDTVLAQALTGKGASLIARQVNKEEASRTIKLEDLAKMVSNVQPSFKDLDSPEDDRVIIVESDAEEDDGIHTETEDTSVLNINWSWKRIKLQLKLKLPSLKFNPPFLISSLPTELNNLPLKFNKRTEEVKELKNQVHNLEIKLLRDLKEIPTKLEDFTKTVALVQAKLKTLDTLPGLLSHIIKALNKFAQEAEKESTESGFDDEIIHMPGSINISVHKKIEKEVKAEAARCEGEIRKEELIDLLCLEVVNKYYNDKLQYDKYCDKMLNRRAASRITNCDVLTRKGLITLKVYIEDGTNEIIPNFKASDMYLGE